MDDIKNIAVLGAGFGGLRAAKVLERKFSKLGLAGRYNVILIDRNEYHTYTPLLYEVATTSKETANMCELRGLAAYDVPSIVAGSRINFMRKEVSAIDVESAAISFASGGELKADYIVLALGAEPNFFGIPGIKEYTLLFKTLLDALRVRDAIWNLAMENPECSISVIIGGGGSSGVELAGEIKNWCGELEGSFPKCRLAVTIVEQDVSILPGFDARVVRLANLRLKKLGVAVVTGKRIAAVKSGEVGLEGGSRLPFDVFIWAGGIKAPALLSRVRMTTEEKGRAIVGDGMECLPETPHLKLAAKVYGLGDNICFQDPQTSRPIPSVARAAISQAWIVASNIVEEIRSREEPRHSARLRKYVPREYPYIIPIGGKYAIAKIGLLVMGGFIGWVLKGLVELNYLISILPLGKAFRIWIKGLIVFARNDRLG